METNLTRLRQIIAVARTASFTRAARDEGITQPALSRSIQAFEQQHGLRLFDRGRSGVRLTSAGLMVVQQAQAILAAATDLDRSMRMHGSGDFGRVGIGLGPLIGSLLVPALARSMLRDHPQVHLVTIIRPPDQMLEKLLDDTIDVIVGNSWQIPESPDLEIRPLVRLPLRVVARCGHPLTGAGPIEYGRLREWPFASAVELARPEIDTGGGLVSDNYHILRDVTAETDCLWITSPAFVASELAAGTMTMLDVTEMPYQHSEICMVTRRGRSRSPACHAAIGTITAMIAGLSTAEARTG